MDLLSAYPNWTGRTEAPRRGRLYRIGVNSTMWLTVLMPFIGLAAAASWFSFRPGGWMNVITFIVMYAIAGFGVTVGYHRLAAHRSFVAHPLVRFFVIGAGSMAMQGPAIKWVATHRRHHQRSDQEGDPHSPKLHGDSFVGLLRGLWHAHTGWLLKSDVVCSDSSIRDLAADPVVRAVDRTYIFWVIAGALLPFFTGLICHATITGALAALVWGFVVRIGLMHHVTWSVNSICHTFGYRTYHTADDSRNNPVVAVLSLGEGWHNNHHAFPTSARHGLRWYEPDISYWFIGVLKLLGLASEIRVPTREQCGQRLVSRLG